MKWILKFVSFCQQFFSNRCSIFVKWTIKNNTMIIVRNVFHLKFGKAKEAIAIWKDILEAVKKSNLHSPEMRLLSDLSGASYTLVVELHLKSFLDMNPNQVIWATTPAFQELYEKFKPLCESGTKEYYKIEYIV